MIRTGSDDFELDVRMRGQPDAIVTSIRVEEYLRTEQDPLPCTNGELFAFSLDSSGAMDPGAEVPTIIMSQAEPRNDRQLDTIGYTSTDKCGHLQSGVEFRTQIPLEECELLNVSLVSPTSFRIEDSIDGDAELPVGLEPPDVVSPGSEFVVFSDYGGEAGDRGEPLWLDVTAESSIGDTASFTLDLTSLPYGGTGSPEAGSIC